MPVSGDPDATALHAVLTGRQVPNVTLLSGLEKVPCLVLLGDMGLGKSTTLEREFERAKEANEAPGQEFLLVDLRGQSELTINARLFGSAPFEAWKTNRCDLTVFLDSLDESWRRLPELTEILMTGFELHRTGTQKALRLRMTCRSGEWHRDLEGRLGQFFGRQKKGADSPVQVYWLAPLTFNDVSIAASAHGINPFEFLDLVEKRDLQPIASQPITLFMLIQEFRKRRTLPESRVELYERACRRFCDDLHAEGGSVKARKSTAGQRLEIAGRVAVASILGDRPLINPNTDIHNDNPSALDVGAIASDLASGLVPAGRETDAVQETLQTALFSEALNGAQSWRHLSYAEFLTARELVKRLASENEIFQLLSVDAGKSRMIPPSLEETVAWAVEMKPALFDVLIERNASALLRCNQLWLTDTRKERLLTAVFDAVRNNEALMDTATEAYWQKKLAHPRLAKQLRPLIADRTEPERIREAALDLVRLCVPDELIEECVQVFADQSSPMRVRTSAAGALSASASKKTPAILRSRVQPRKTRGWNIEHRAVYFRMLWPEHVRFDEMAEALGPERPNVSGVHEKLIYSFPKKLPAKELVPALRWLRRNLDALPPPSVEKLIRKGFQRLGERSVRALIVDILVLVARGNRKIEKDPQEKGWPLVTPSARRSLWTEIAKRAVDLDQCIINGGFEDSGFLTPADTLWFARRGRTESNPAIRKRWIVLFCHTFADDRREHWDAAWRFEGDTEVDRLILRRKARSRPIKDPIGPPAPPRPPPESLPKKIDRGLTAFASGKLEAAAFVFEALVGDQSFHPPGDLTTAPGWAELSEDTRLRILNMGADFVRKFQPPSFPLPSNTVNTGVIAAMHYALLLANARPASLDLVPAVIWSHIFPHFLTHEGVAHVENEDGWLRVLHVAWNANPRRASVQLGDFMKDHGEHRLPCILRRLPLATKGQLEKIVFEFLDRFGAYREAVESAHEHLRQRDSKRWREWLLKETRPDRKSWGRFAVNAAVFLFEKGESLVDTCLDRVERDPLWGREFTRQLARRHEWRNWLPHVSAPRLYAYYKWLMEQFPEDPYDSGSSQFTLAHYIERLQTAVFNEFKSRTTPDAILTLESVLASNPPEKVWLGDVLAQMRRNSSQAAWHPVPPKDLLGYLAHPIYPPIRSAGDLFYCVLIAIDRFQETLHGETASIELWNKVTIGRQQFEWSPKDELEISNCLKRHITRELGPMGVRPVREPELKPARGTASAQRSDILLTFRIASQPANAEVIVEVKGTWNKEILTDLQKQLIDRYLDSPSFNHGIYAAFHFACDGWNNPKDKRKSRSLSGMKIDDARRQLDAVLKRAQCQGKQVAVRVVDARLEQTDRLSVTGHFKTSHLSEAGMERV